MSLQRVVFKLFQNARLLLRRPYQSGPEWKWKTGNIFSQLRTEGRSGLGRSSGPPIEYSGPPIQKHIENVRKIFADNVLRRVTNSLSTELRKRTTRQLLFGNATPFFAFVGVSLASGTGIITKEDELEGLCWEIREAVSCWQKALAEAESDLFRQDEIVSLDKFTIGPPIGKGANAVVYAVRKNPFTGNLNSQGFDGSNMSELQIALDEPVQNFPYALKMMFNYDIESNAVSIFKALSKELIPAKVKFLKRLDEAMRHIHPSEVNSKSLESHPHIVSMHCAFTDAVADLPQSFNLYPSALPPRINPDSGLARNMSLFLLMKRYDKTLKEYVAEDHDNVREQVLLLAQILEAVAFINKNNIAHRDMKSDNILLEVTEEGDCPRLVLADFGCCLSGSLTVPFRSHETDRGGNISLMAPEIILAEPGIFSVLNYNKSDCWAAGSLAYELFTGKNPFYRDGAKEPLVSATYREDQLPDLVESGVPPLVADLVSSMMARSPSQRPNAEFAATVLQLYLWAPVMWLQGYTLPSNNDILQWLLCLSTKVLCGGSFPQKGARRSAAEYLLIGSFLRRVHIPVIRDALRWILYRA